MANMSYCRFENTSRDLQDCIDRLHDAIRDGESGKNFYENLGSNYERRALKRLKMQAKDLLQLFEYLGDLD